MVTRIKDLDLALSQAGEGKMDADEWRIHFHVPLHASPGNGLGIREDMLPILWTGWQNIPTPAVIWRWKLIPGKYYRMRCVP